MSLFDSLASPQSVFKLKNTLSATGDTGNVENRYNMLMGGKKNLDKETGDNVRVRRAGPGLAKMRKAHKTLRSIILQRYGNMTECFKEIDADGSGLIRRAELRMFLQRVSKSIPDQVRERESDDDDTRTHAHSPPCMTHTAPSFCIVHDIIRAHSSRGVFSLCSLPCACVVLLQVISGLIGYVDTDGDTKTLSEAEFVRMMSADFLDEL